MAHPYEHTKMLHKKRVKRMTAGYACGGAARGYKRGGAVRHDDEKEDRALVKKMLHEHDVEGKRSKGGSHKYARGGRARHHKRGAPNININVGHPGGAPGGLPLAAAAPVIRPPVAPPPSGPGAMPGGPAAAPQLPGAAGVPPMMPRKRGGRIPKHGPTFEEGKRAGTQVQHLPGKNNSDNLKKPYPITRKAGGRANFGPEGKPTGGRKADFSEQLHPTHKARGDFGEHMKTPSLRGAGSKSGLGRLRKASMEKQAYP